MRVLFSVPAFWRAISGAGLLLLCGCAVYGPEGEGVSGAGIVEAGEAAADIGLAAAAPGGFWGGWGGGWWGGNYEQNNYYNYNRYRPYRHWHKGRNYGGMRDRGFRGSGRR